MTECIQDFSLVCANPMGGFETCEGLNPQFSVALQLMATPTVE